jgi:signal recognition particle receptor subunit beta
MTTIAGAVHVGEALAILATLDVLPESQRMLAAETAAKVANDVLFVAVIGEFKRGKTTLINAMLEDEVLPTGVTPVTAVPTLLRSGRAPSAMLLGNDDLKTTIDLDDLAAYVTEQGNPGNHRGIREVVVTHPAQVLRSGLTFVDTPGMGSVYAHNTDTTEAFLPRVDVAVLVLSVDAPLSAAEAALLKRARGSAARTAVCLNKVDLLSGDEVDEVVSFITQQLDGAGGTFDVPVFPISARRAMEGRPGSGVPELLHWLEHEVAGDRRALIAERSVRILEALVGAAEAAVSVEEAVAAHSAAALELASAAFEDAQRELASEAAEARSLLRVARAEVTSNVVAPRAEQLRAGLPTALLAGGDDWTEELRAAAVRWIRDTEPELVQAMVPRLQRYAVRLQDRVDHFVVRAGAAFGVTLPSPAAIGGSLTLPPVRVEFSGAPGAVAMGVMGLRQRFPGRVGDRWRAAARRQRAFEDADRLAGRLHHASCQAVAAASDAWAAEVDERWRMASDAMVDAVARGRRAGATEPSGLSLDPLRIQLARIRWMVSDA